MRCYGAPRQALWLVSLILAGCANISVLPTGQSQPSSSPTWVPPTLTRSSTDTVTNLVLTPTETETPVPCDPRLKDYCLDEAHFIFQPPVNPPANDRVDRGYAYGSTYEGNREPHHGVEFPNPVRTPVLAAADGIVYYSGDDALNRFSPWLDFYGNIVILEHPLKDAPYAVLYTLYAHLSQVDVAQGQTVTSGEQIGLVGMSGAAFGYHLHFEVRVRAEEYYSTLNPELWLIPHPGNGALVFQFLDNLGNPAQAGEIEVEYLPAPGSSSAGVFFPENYAPEIQDIPSPDHENAALGDLPAGNYRITLEIYGAYFERFVEIKPGISTRVAFTFH